MQIQKVQSNQTNFGVTVRFKPETIKMLHRKGENFYYMYDCYATWLESNEDNALMLISHTRKNKGKTNLVANLFEQKDDKFYMSETPAIRPLYHIRDGKLCFSNLQSMYDELKEKLIELKRLDFSIKLFPKSKGWD